MRRMIRITLASLLLAAGVVVIRREAPRSTGEQKTAPKAAQIAPITPSAPQEKSDSGAMARTQSVVYVSPTGSDQAKGSQDAPLATVAKALAMVESSGTIYLREGVYREQVNLNAGTKAAESWLTVAAMPGENVIFEGGSPVDVAEEYPGAPGLYLLSPVTDEKIFAYEWFYYDLWENESRIRYRKQADLEGVLAYPGSFCVLDDRRLLVHTRDGRHPKDVGLWRNRDAVGFNIGRPKTRIKGITFQNYVGGTNARALSLREAGEVQECRFFNCVRGISISSQGNTISGCEMRDVGLGIISAGNNTTIENCLLLAAQGRFSFSELNEHLRDGIRFYYPATGGGVRGCVTSGFWGGLYIKSRTWEPDAIPILIENNLFLDGINCGSGNGSPVPFAGTSAQPKNRYLNNLVGPSDYVNDSMVRLPGIGATVEGNYFFHLDGKRQKVKEDDPKNREGAAPFRLMSGELTIQDGVSLSEDLTKTLALIKSNADQFWSQWRPTPSRGEEEDASPPTFETSPVIASSDAGAVITAVLTGPARLVLKYRAAGVVGWKVVRGVATPRASGEAMTASAPVERTPDRRERYQFDLTLGQLTQGTRYHFAIEILGQELKAIAKEEGEFLTTGGPKEIHVNPAGRDGKDRGSSEAPFRQLQAALDVALPGDTVILAAGVYTQPATLERGGSEGGPITIRGAGKKQSLLDGGKEHAAMIALKNAPYMTISDVTVRWFGNAGIMVEESPHFTLLRSHFQNAPIASNSFNGHGLELFNSPHATVSYNIFTALEGGVVAVQSAPVTLTHNTAFRNVYTAINLNGSSAGSIVEHNSLTFTGNDSIVVKEKNLNVLSDAQWDYNNYGTFLRGDAKARPENDFTLSPRYGRVESKAIVRGDIGVKPGVVNRFYTLGTWREFSGKDKGTIYADPLYADPLKGDFRVLRGSPNILPDGKVIGAEEEIIE